mmetsp:Transcript_93779/g.254530  ORF Transcript_93779/g.254530 Transcript_93779/m.254530 type:complete len:252 (-) Transcript_93779:142-897(-)
MRSSFSGEPYSGNSNKLKHVCAVGSLSVGSPPFRWSTGTGDRSCRPPTGARSLAVTKERNRFFCTASKPRMMSQKASTYGEPSSKPSSKKILRSWPKSRSCSPQAINPSSVLSRAQNRGESQTWRTPSRKGSNCSSTLVTRSHSQYRRTNSSRFLRDTGRSLPPWQRSLVAVLPSSPSYETVKSKQKVCSNRSAASMGLIEADGGSHCSRDRSDRCVSGCTSRRSSRARGSSLIFLKTTGGNLMLRPGMLL